jgi:ATP-binding cassette subfamily F protein uup
MDKLIDHVFIFEGNGDIRDYAGNYTEYRNMKLEQEAAEARSQQPQKTEQKPVPKDSKNKLTYREKKALEELERTLAALESEKTAIEQMLSRGTNTSDQVVKASERMADILTTLDEKTDRWLALSEKESN